MAEVNISLGLRISNALEKVGSTITLKDKDGIKHNLRVAHIIRVLEYDNSILVYFTDGLQKYFYNKDNKYVEII